MTDNSFSGVLNLQSTSNSKYEIIIKPGEEKST